MVPYTVIKNIEDLNIELAIKSSHNSGEKLGLNQLFKFDTKKLVKLSYENFEYVGETIEKIASGLIEKYEFDIMKRNFYSYIMRELMRNVVEHSKADEFYLCIYINKTYEIGFKIIDNGVGIMKSLNSNPTYNVYDHKTALAFSIRPGITKTYKKDPTIDDMWQNSGFGLYMVSSIGDRLGWFSIKSGDYKLSVKNNLKLYDKSKIKGCETTVVIRTNNKVNTSKLLKEISQVGNELANNSSMFSKYAEIKTASKASTLINDFS